MRCGIDVVGQRPSDLGHRTCIATDDGTAVPETLPYRQAPTFFKARKNREQAVSVEKG